MKKLAILGIMAELIDKQEVELKRISVPEEKSIFFTGLLIRIEVVI